MTRTEYEQQGFQRKNPHLFTTPTQSVNADGSLVTYEQVTMKFQETRDKLVAIARDFAAREGFHADYWFLMDELHDIKESVDYLDSQMELVLRGFTDNYRRTWERTHIDGKLMTTNRVEQAAESSAPVQPAQAGAVRHR